MNLIYDHNNNIFTHFVQHAAFGLKHDIPRHGQEKNWKEKIGDFGLWMMEHFPGKMWSSMKEPRWITLVLTNLSMAAVSFAFYPRESIQLTKAVLLRVPLPSREAVKFAAYLTTIAHIVSAAFRAYGRFSNDQLMDAWYNGGRREEEYVFEHAIVREDKRN